MTRSVLSTVVFALTFGSSVLLVGLIFGFPGGSGNLYYYKKVTSADRIAAAIENVLEKDRRFANIRDRQIRDLQLKGSSESSTAEFAQIIASYVADMESIERSGLPDEFRAEWLSHVKAWRDYAAFLEDFSGEDEAASIDELADHRLNLEIERTWFKTLSVGQKYGSKFIDR